MGAVDPSIVLWGQALAYTLYALVAISLVGWFAYRVTRPGNPVVKPGLFYSFVGLLVVTGVSLHVVTYNTIPWSPLDLHRSQITPDRTFEIRIADHRFILPADELLIRCNERVLFDVSSQDLTYGFGLFRQDHSMLFQMQVIPGHRNDLLWRFERNGVYSIRSTEYSGPEGYDMVVEDAVEVTGCPTGA